MVSFDSVGVIYVGIIPVAPITVPGTERGLVRRGREPSHNRHRASPRPHLYRSRRRPDLPLEVSAGPRPRRLREAKIVANAATDDRQIEGAFHVLWQFSEDLPASRRQLDRVRR